jgi:hypothetical protein
MANASLTSSVSFTVQEIKAAQKSGFCDPDWIQTNDLLLRRQLLYSAELPDQRIENFGAANIGNQPFTEDPPAQKSKV